MHYLHSLFQLLVLSAVGLVLLSWLNRAMELNFYHGFWYLLDPWSLKPETYPKYGPRFFYACLLAAVAGLAWYLGNGAMVAAAATLWLAVMAPKAVNGAVIAYRLAIAFRQRFILKETYNPYLHHFAQLRTKSLARDPFGPVIETIKEHSWGVPTAAAVRLVMRQGKIVEACAGTGYWAWLIWQSGGDIIAYDQSPGLRLRNNHHRLKPSWFPVRKGDGAVAAARHSDRALLLCWPTHNRLSYDALKAYRGDTVIFVGANDGKVCVTGSREFHEELQKSWQLAEEVAIPCWGELKDSVRVYKRAVQMETVAASAAASAAAATG